MAKKTFTVDVCDVCGKPSVASFRISEQGGASRKVTVCDDKGHGAPVLRSLLEAAKEARPSTIHGPGRPTRVYTMEEVAAARIGAEGKPAKKARQRA